jgi:hypothetical protein
MSLVADIRASAGAGPPRRDDVLNWLAGFVLRSEKKGYSAEPGEMQNLVALDEYVRANQIPSTGHLPSA